MPTDTDMAMKNNANRLQPPRVSSGAASRCRRWPSSQVRSSPPLAHLLARTCLVPRRLPFPATKETQRPMGQNQARAWTIVPRVSLTETLTDNINLSSTDKQSGLISQLSPGVRIDARTARLKMYFDYALNGIVYSTGQQWQPGSECVEHIRYAGSNRQLALP